MRRSCQFNEYFNRLSRDAMQRSHKGAVPCDCSKKKSCGNAVVEADRHRRGKGLVRWIHACETEAWRSRLKALSTGYSPSRYSGHRLISGWGMCIVQSSKRGIPLLHN